MMKPRNAKQDAGGAVCAEQPKLRPPEMADAVRVHDLIAACPPLDTNSLYCNLLQCTDFADTCIVAEQDDGRVVGWISGYRLPQDESTLFVWQVAVHEGARGTGLAKKMLLTLLERPALRDVRFLRTTVTADNAASKALFRSLSRRSNAPLREEAGFDERAHFHGRHASEGFVVIGPIPADRSQAFAA